MGSVYLLVFELQMPSEPDEVVYAYACVCGGDREAAIRRADSRLVTYSRRELISAREVEGQVLPVQAELIEASRQSRNSLAILLRRSLQLP